MNFMSSFFWFYSNHVQKHNCGFNFTLSHRINQLLAQSFKHFHQFSAANTHKRLPSAATTLYGAIMGNFNDLWVIWASKSEITFKLQLFLYPLIHVGFDLLLIAFVEEQRRRDLNRNR